MASAEKKTAECFFDEVLFSKYQNIKVSVLSDVKPDAYCLVTLRKKFLLGEIADVVLTYQKNISITYHNSLLLLKKLRTDVVLDKTTPALIRDQYVLAIDEKALKINLLLQTQATATGGDITSAMHSFQEYSHTLYGKIDDHLFCKVMQILERDVLRKSHKYTIDNKRLLCAERLLSIVTNYRTRQPLFHSLPVSERRTKEKESYIADAEELKLIFENALADYRLNTDWSVVIDKRGRRSTISVSYTTQRIFLPSSSQLEKRGKRRRLTAARIQGLIVHEIGTHVVRNENGIHSRCRLLGLGLSQYEQGEEGLATYREQVAQSLTGYAGFEAYFAIGIAQGFDGGVPRNFADVHVVLTDYYQVFEGATEQHAKELAWNKCLRIFRGTTGNVPGVVFTKDLLYRHGNIRHWEAVKTGQLADVAIDAGKFDPTNQAHVTFIRSLYELEHSLDHIH